MRSHALLVLSTLAVLACAPAEPQPPPRAAPSRAAPELVFGWKTPAVAAVVHERERDGLRATERWVLCARALGGGLMEVRETGHPDGQERPVLLISSDGTVYDVAGLEPWLERMLEERGATHIRAGRLNTPVMVAQLKEKYAETWHLWVDTWLNFDPRRGKQVVEASVPFGETELSVPQAFEYLGRSREQPGLVRMRMRSVLEGPEVSRALSRMTLDLVQAEGLARDQVERLELRRTVEFEILTDPATLMPRRVTGKSITAVTIAGHAARERVQADDYRFDWRAPAELRKRCQR